MTRFLNYFLHFDTCLHIELLQIVDIFSFSVLKSIHIQLVCIYGPFMDSSYLHVKSLYDKKNRRMRNCMCLSK